jgi:adenine-specific DNA methylase
MPKPSAKGHTVPQKPANPAPVRRLIEEWLPIAELSEESVRERRSMTALPPTYYLHVWWARRPLVASRAAILGALLPAGADHAKFLHVLGIHGDPVAAKKRMADAARNLDENGEREDLGANPYGYDRAFKHLPSDAEIMWLNGSGQFTVLDPTAGGGSIPFEATRLHCRTLANDLNPVAWLVMKATVEFPARFGAALLKRYTELAKKFIELAAPRFGGIFPPEKPGVTVDGYLWARTITCPYCGGIVPLSPNWRLTGDGTGVKLIPDVSGGKRVVRFEIVTCAEEQSPGTVKGGDGSCPFPDCQRVISGDNDIKPQAQAGKMGEQLFTVVYREEKVVGHTKQGKPKIKRERGFRAPRPEDDVAEQVKAALAAKMPEWLAKGIVPDEDRYVGPADRSALYGVVKATDMFSSRQLYGHCVGVEVFHELVEEVSAGGKLSELDKAALVYLTLAMDKFADWNSRGCTWEQDKQRLGHTFARHDFALRWSFAEMAAAVTGSGLDWVTSVTAKALKELIELTGHAPAADDDSLFAITTPVSALKTPEIAVTCTSGDNLSHVADASVDTVVMDPPYYDNVMYAELADFFYVWLKRTAGLLFPEQFSSYLTDKDREAVANPAKFKDFTKVKGSGGAKKRASRDYQERMQAIFAEMRRVLKPEGIMVLMFTHKATGAWDALAKGLVDAGFEITASWPVNTEAEGSLHIKDKNAAKSTIFLVCRPRAVVPADAEPTYWEEVEPKVTEVVRQHVAEFQANGIGGVDLYLSCFGPALEVFSKHWPMKRGRALQKPPPVRGAQLRLIEEEDWDPYAVRPEDALMAARKAVKDWRLDQIATIKRQTHVDPVTEFFVLAWDAFQAPEFPADEALKLARVVGVNFDEQLRGHILELDGGDVVLWDSVTRSQKGSLGSMQGECILDALHHTARLAREQNTGVAREALERAGLDKDDRFQKALQAVLNVLPTPKMISGKDSPLAGAAADADALERLRRLVFAQEIPQATQWQGVLFENQ